MTLPYGTISLSQVNTELVRPENAQINMNDSEVRALFVQNTINSQISMSDGNGRTSYFIFTIQSLTSLSNVDLRSFLVQNGWDQIRAVIVSNYGTISSSSTGTPALTISGSFPRGISLNNYGSIIGKGGNGGPGRGNISTFNNYPASYHYGQSGGIGLAVYVPVRITNNAYIAGGGGGGGGGGTYIFYNTKYGSWSGGGGGGGGGASSYFASLGGAAGDVGNGDVYLQNSEGGSNGGYNYIGYGGQGNRSTYSTNFISGTGGNGGSWGNSGATGQEFNYASSWYAAGPGVGGAAGAAVVGNANITWISYGSIYGGIS